MAIGTGMALLGSAAIGAGASIIGGQKAKSAAKTNAAATEAAAQQQYEQTQEAIGNYTASNPYSSLGERYGDQMTSRLAGLMGYEDEQPSIFEAAGTKQAGDPASSPFGKIWFDPNTGAVRPNSVGGQPSYYLDGPFGTSEDEAGSQTGAVAGRSDIWDGAGSRTDFLRSTPGYQFTFDEGMKAVEQSLSAKNQTYSGKAGLPPRKWSII